MSYSRKFDARGHQFGSKLNTNSFSSPAAEANAVYDFSNFPIAIWTRHLMCSVVENLEITCNSYSFRTKYFSVMVWKLPKSNIVQHRNVVLRIKYLTPALACLPARRLMKFRREKSISKSWSATISWCQDCSIKRGRMTGATYHKMG